jgi:hypothetical protein
MNAEKIKDLAACLDAAVECRDVRIAWPGQSVAEIASAANQLRRIPALLDEVEALTRERDVLLADSLSLADRLADSVIRVETDSARLDYIERTFSGMTNRERYLPVQMIWGKGCNGRTLREACDKYMARDARHEPKDAE